jgi:hypothetical protein
MSTPDPNAADAADVSTDVDTLRRDNEELRRRLDVAVAELDTLRRESLVRQAEVRSLAEALPLAVSRRRVIGDMLREARHHPDRRGVAGRAVKKLGRAPRKAWRLAWHKLR